MCSTKYVDNAETMRLKVRKKKIKIEREIFEENSFQIKFFITYCRDKKRSKNNENKN